MIHRWFMFDTHNFLSDTFLRFENKNKNSMYRAHVRYLTDTHCDAWSREIQKINIAFGEWFTYSCISSEHFETKYVSPATIQVQSALIQPLIHTNTHHTVYNVSRHWYVADLGVIRTRISARYTHTPGRRNQLAHLESHVTMHQKVVWYTADSTVDSLLGGGLIRCWYMVDTWSIHAMIHAWCGMIHAASHVVSLEWYGCWYMVDTCDDTCWTRVIHCTSHVVSVDWYGADTWPIHGRYMVDTCGDTWWMQYDMTYKQDHASHATMKVIHEWYLIDSERFLGSTLDLSDFDKVP